MNMLFVIIIYVKHYCDNGCVVSHGNFKMIEMPQYSSCFPYKQHSKR